MRKPFIFNSILGIVSKKSELDSATIDRIATAGSSFHRRQTPDQVRVTVVKSRTGRSALFVWNRADTSQYAEGLIANQGPISAALNGYLSGGKRLTDILPQLVSQGVARVSSDHGGVFTIYTLDAERDVITVSNTLHGTRPTLWADGIEGTVVGTSVPFVSWVANGFSYPAYNLPGIADYVLNEQHSTYNTPFLGTHVLPANCVATADGHAVRCRPVDDALKALCLSEAVPTAAYFDELADYLVDSAKTFADGTHYALGLTGGRDSRLLLSGLLGAGVDVSVQVNGFPEDADVILARRIADTMRVPMTYYETYAGQSSFSTVEIHQYLWKYLRDTDGMSMNRPTQPSDCRQHFFLNAAPDSARPVEHYQNYDGSMFSGLAGEMWRGGSFLIPSRSYLAGKIWLDKLEAEQLISTFGKSPYTYFLRPEFKAQFEDFFRAWIRENTAPDNYMRIFELIPIVHYYGMNHNFIDDIILLADNRVMRKIQQVRLRDRIIERLPFEVIARLTPQLRDLPLENTRWAFERDQPYPGREDGWQARAPVPHAAQRASNYAYYMIGVCEKMRLATREILFDSPGSNLLFEVVDRRTVEHVYRSPDLFHWRWSWGIWNLCQGALVLSGALIPDTPRRSEKIVEVRLDAPWAQAAFDICTALNRLDSKHAPAREPSPSLVSSHWMRRWWDRILSDARREVSNVRSKRPTAGRGWLYVEGSIRLAIGLLRRIPPWERSGASKTPSATGDRLMLALARSRIDTALKPIGAYHKISEPVWQGHLASLILMPALEIGEITCKTLGEAPVLRPDDPRSSAARAELDARTRQLSAAIRRGLGVEQFETLPV